LGDLLGHRRLFLFGVLLFSAASLGCGLSDSQPMLISARAVQGLGGAVVTAVALSLIVSLFGEEPGELAQAMGIYGFVCASGGSIGVLAGGYRIAFLLGAASATAASLLAAVLLRRQLPTPSKSIGGVKPV
jgi:MFS family permease